MIVAFGLPAAEGAVQKAVVTDLENLMTGVVCVKQGEDWEPIYMMVRRFKSSVAVKKSLPSCFSLNDEAKEALNNIWYIDQDEIGEAI